LNNVYNQNEANNVLKKIKEFPIEIVIGLSDSVRIKINWFR
jgi:hypothetical protein